ncbi:hypothetical protein UFOVP223_60 [uncultured Caudovirales phage]|uniref:Uncharacterized protein n=1 Tax=uncultured Caudovirales phage TaxID=2100421 RepID=A0A6J5L4X0_9CAUD|nr:hypothetical protein UFOVP110_104 [uncultured Caudovirales phage]CAB5219338.1 hypothetical protein UFOVP223_60 [uncultured Caudovirales phage]
MGPTAALKAERDYTQDVNHVDFTVVALVPRVILVDAPHNCFLSLT